MKTVACLAAAVIVTFTSLADASAQQRALVQPRLVPTPDNGYVQPATYMLGVYTTPIPLGYNPGPLASNAGPLHRTLTAARVRVAPNVVPNPQFGLRVDSVVPGSAAHRAGLEPGDVLVSGNGRTIDSKPALQTAIQYSQGQLYLGVINVRNGQLTHVMSYPERIDSYPVPSQCR